MPSTGYSAPGDMTIIAWHSWFVVTDPETGDDEIVHFTSHNGDVWDDLPDDGCLGLRLIHAARNNDGDHYAVSFHDDWYYRAESNLGVIWGSTSHADADLRPGRYKKLSVKQGMTAPYGVYAPVQEEMSRTVK
jgi:hypothetical protein